MATTGVNNKVWGATGGAGLVMGFQNEVKVIILYLSGADVPPDQFADAASTLILAAVVMAGTFLSGWLIPGGKETGTGDGENQSVVELKVRDQAVVADMTSRDEADA